MGRGYCRTQKVSYAVLQQPHAFVGGYSSVFIFIKVLEE